MPRLVYKPEGAEPKTWDFSFGRLLSPERIVIEKATGLGWDSVKAAFWDNSTPVIGAFLYVFQKREMPALRPTDFVFCDDDFDVDLNDDEAREAIAAMEAQPNLDDEAVAALAELKARFADEDADPKAEA
jgi:hypothetical protein